jgi:hypothetical protein
MAEHPDDRNPLHQQKTTIASYCSVLAAIVRIQTAGRKMQNLISALSMILPDDGTVAVLMGGGAGTRLFPLTGGDHVEKIGTAPHHRVERLSEHS